MNKQVKQPNVYFKKNQGSEPELLGELSTTGTLLLGPSGSAQRIPYDFSLLVPIHSESADPVQSATACSDNDTSRAAEFSSYCIVHTEMVMDDAIQQVIQNLKDAIVNSRKRKQRMLLFEKRHILYTLTNTETSIYIYICTHTHTHFSIAKKHLNMQTHIRIGTKTSH